LGKVRATQLAKGLRTRLLETDASARFANDGWSKPASRQYWMGNSPGRNPSPMEVTAATIKSSEGYGG
jgi:hypothetical protein